MSCVPGLPGPAVPTCRSARHAVSQVTPCRGGLLLSCPPGEAKSRTCDSGAVGVMGSPPLLSLKGARDKGEEACSFGAVVSLSPQAACD